MFNFAFEIKKKKSQNMRARCTISRSSHGRSRLDYAYCLRHNFRALALSAAALHATEMLEALKLPSGSESESSETECGTRDDIKVIKHL